MQNNLHRYRNNDVVTANQGRLIVMLYDGLIKQLDLGAAELRKQSPKLDLAHNALTKAQEILNELETSLDLEKGGEVAQNLLSLYRFFTRTLVQANIDKQPDSLSAIRKQIVDLREAWVQIQNTEQDAGQKTQDGYGVNVAG